MLILALVVASMSVSAVVAMNYVSSVKFAESAANASQNSAFVFSSGTVLLSESKDIDSDGYYESPVMKAGSNPPSSGGFIPDSSKAPKLDAFRSPIGYCSWDNGSPANLVDNRIMGANMETATLTEVVFAVVSSGADKTFQTSCTDILGNLKASGDDAARIVTNNEISRNMQASMFWGDSVSNLAALNALDKSSLVDGEARAVIRNNENKGQVYFWNASEGIWKPVGGD